MPQRTTPGLDQCRPPPCKTDRRSLNRARPPPIYMQREEEITPGVWPPGYVFNSRNGEKGTQKASIPSASSTSPSSSTSSSAAATSASTRPSSNTRNNTNAPPAAATSSASSGASSVSRFNMARRVMSENLDAGGSRGYSINASTNGRGSSSGSDGAPLPSMAANNATIRSQAHNPSTNRLTRLNLGSQRSGSIPNSSSRPLTGSLASLAASGSNSGAMRTNRNLTLSEAGRAGRPAVNARQLATQGYAQLRSNRLSSENSSSRTGSSVAAPSMLRLPSLGGGSGSSSAGGASSSSRAGTSGGMTSLRADRHKAANALVPVQ